MKDYSCWGSRMAHLAVMMLIFPLARLVFSSGDKIGGYSVILAGVISLASYLITKFEK